MWSEPLRVDKKLSNANSWRETYEKDEAALRSRLQVEQYISNDVELCLMPSLSTKIAMRKKPSPNRKIIEPERYS